MSEDQLRRELAAAFKNRAMMVHHIYDELSAEIGPEKAEAVLKRAIYRRGVELGQRLIPYAPDDMEGLRNAFVSAVPDDGRLFQPDILRCDASGLDIQMQRCPLKEAWQESGLDDSAVARLCRIAAVVDNGTFEGAGFAFSAETWEPGKEGCCRLHIRPGKRRD